MLEVKERIAAIFVQLGVSIVYDRWKSRNNMACLSNNNRLSG